MSTPIPAPPELPPLSKPAAAKQRIKLAPKMDVEFLGRTYVTMLWLGAVWTACAWAVTQSGRATASFAGGLLLGALLLKSQEIFVRKVVAPRANGVAGKRDLIARVPIALLLPVKYLAVGLALGVLIERDWLHPIAFAVGFLSVQIVIVSKVVGRFAANALRQPNQEKESQDSKQNTEYCR